MEKDLSTPTFTLLNPRFAGFTVGEIQQGEPSPVKGEGIIIPLPWWEGIRGGGSKNPNELTTSNTAQKATEVK